MNNYDELIERLKETRQFRKVRKTKTTEPIYVLIRVDDLDEAITTLRAQQEIIKARQS